MGLNINSQFGISAADLGYFFGVTVSAPDSISTGIAVGTANDTRVCQFVLPFRVVVGKITLEVTTNVAATFVGAGIYDSAGNRLVHSGAVDSATTGVKTVSVTAVTLEPGVYYLAQTSTNNSVQLRLLVNTVLNAFLNAQTTKKAGTAANASSGGVLPSTLGAITAANFAPAQVLFER